jgi:hypothetical protein
MIQFGMKLWRSLILVLIVVAPAALGARYMLEKRAKRKREIAYQSALRSYSERLGPGITRKEVEDYLRARNVEFGQMCCVDGQLSNGVWDDLAKIGQEGAPWYCSEHNVYVAFQFTGPKRNRGVWTADPSDTLKAVNIFHRLEGCL